MTEPVRMQSWVKSANNPQTEFPLNNLPYGVFSHKGTDKRLGVAIGDHVLDLYEVAGDLPLSQALLSDRRGWNGVMESGPPLWGALRSALIDLLRHDARPRPDALLPLSDIRLHMPFEVVEFTDFFSCENHALNAGRIYRGDSYSLPPNWHHMPVGFAARASSVVVSGTDIHRPWGQMVDAGQTSPRWGQSACLDIELELGAIVGRASTGSLSVDEADENIFGFVLLNDWSARDLQAWESRPLGPLVSKSMATTISPWIVTGAALEPFRVRASSAEHQLLPYLEHGKPAHYDLGLSIHLQPAEGRTRIVSQTNARELYFSAPQQLAHLASTGAPMRTGDLLGSGTISGADRHSRGSFLEMSWGGQDPLMIDGVSRAFLQDGDTVTLTGGANTDTFRIGFGDCSGRIVSSRR